MPASSTPARQRIGQVTLYAHHGGFWLYHRHGGKAVREHVGSNIASAECEASLLNARLAASRAGIDLFPLVAARLGPSAPPPPPPPPSVPSLTAGPSAPPVDITVAELRRRFLMHHERVLDSSLQTVSRYRAASQYLEAFAGRQGYANAGAVGVPSFIEHLRTVEVSPNGHARTARRRLRDKGIQYILECCRSLYHFGLRQHLLPHGFANPFSAAGVGKVRIRDAKPTFVFDPNQELDFLRAADPWAFGVHFLLAKTGVRPGELVRLLIEDVDLTGGWLWVRGKPELGWVTKTNRERRVPLAPEVADVVRHLVGERREGLLFLRRRLATGTPPQVAGGRAELVDVARRRLELARAAGGFPPSRADEAKVYAGIWRDAGAVSVDRVRTSFIQAARRAGLDATCPKSWRHTFATLLQEANVDLLVRQETLGHKPASAGASALGMTGVYTHTSPELHRREIERALRLRPDPLALAQTYVRRAIGERAKPAPVPARA